MAASQQPGPANNDVVGDAPQFPPDYHLPPLPGQFGTGEQPAQDFFHRFFLTSSI